MQNIEIIALPQFEKEIKLLAKKYPSIVKDFETLLLSIKINPAIGISLGNNCYKIRFKITSKNSGKSGGARVITFVKILINKVFLVSIYDKSEKDSTNKKEIEILLKNNDLL